MAEIQYGELIRQKLAHAVLVMQVHWKEALQNESNSCRIHVLSDVCMNQNVGLMYRVNKCCNSMSSAEEFSVRHLSYCCLDVKNRVFVRVLMCVLSVASVSLYSQYQRTVM